MGFVLAVALTGTVGASVSAERPEVAPSSQTGTPEASSGRNFTVAGPQVTRDELLLAGTAPVGAAQPAPESRLRGGLTDDGEDAFDAMIEQFEARYPNLIRFGGMSDDGSAVRWVLIPSAPSDEQIALLESYGLPLRVEYGTAPTHSDMSNFAGALHALTGAEGPIDYQGYGFNDDHTGLRVFYNAPANLSLSDVEAEARDLIDKALQWLGDETLAFDLDFVERTAANVDYADITGGYGLTLDSKLECTTGFTAIRNGNLGVITAKHCPNNLDYRGNSGTLEFGAPASDMPNGQVDLQFHRTLSPHATTKKYLHYDGDERFVTSVTEQVNSDIGETRCMRGAKTGFGCAIIQDVNICDSFPSGDYCGLVSTTNDIMEPGDSGAPWFDDIPGRAVGIAKGGDPSSTGVSLPISAACRST